MIVGIEHLPEKSMRIGVVNIDMAITEISYQQIPGSGTKRRRRYSHSPRCIQGSAGCNSRDEITVQSVLVDKTQSCPGHIVILACILQGIGHIQRSVEILDVERSISTGKAGIGKRTGE